MICQKQIKLTILKNLQLLHKLMQRSIGKIVFTDVKNFLLLAPKNPQNDRVYRVGKKTSIVSKHLLAEKIHFSQNVMVSADVCARGKTQPHFVLPGVKIDTHNYRKTLLKKALIPDCKKLYSKGDYIFQQGCAPSHTASTTAKFLQQENPAFL